MNLPCVFHPHSCSRQDRQGNVVFASILFTLFLLTSSQAVHSAIIKDISLSLKATPTPVSIKSKLTYSLEVKNVGNRAVTNVVLKNTLPSDVVFRSASPDCKFATQSDQEKGILTCRIARLARNSSVNWSIAVRTSAKTGKLENSAKVRFKGTDKNPADNKATVTTRVKSGNSAPVASDISLRSDSAIPYIEQKLIGTDADKDTLSYVLDAPEKGKGYTLAYLSSQRGVLYVTIAPSYVGTISLPYRVTDGKLFSKPATVKIVVRASQPADDKGLGGKDIDPELYASFREASLSNDLFGAPGAAPTEPPSVDLSPNFPAAGDQGRQSSCVAWAAGYALKSYQEGVEMNWPFNTSAHLFSPAFIYNQINNGQDQGSQIYDALDLMIAQGASTLATMPYSDTDYRTQPNATAKKEASRFKALSRDTVNGTKAIKAALANRKPVVIGMEVFDQFYKLSGNNSVYNSKQGSATGPHGRHAITVVGYDNNKYGGAFKVINSWGSSWGDKGYFWLPYSFAEEVVFQAWVMEDKKNQDVPDDNDNDIVPPIKGKLPNLQVKSWNATYDPQLGGEGQMEWRVINSGKAKAPAGATVAIMLSKDRTINASDTFVIYDEIPFALDVGKVAYRSFDEGNSISFKIPGNIEAGDYWMALWVDDLNEIKESKEDDNISLSSDTVSFADTLPDLAVQSWYSYPYNFFGDYSLTYEVANNGATNAPKNFSISLVLSNTDNLGEGKQWWLFYENYPYSLPPSYVAYRDFNSPGFFNLYYDINNRSIPQGYFYLAFWADAENKVTESDEANNTSFSWGLVSTYLGSGASSLSTDTGSGLELQPEGQPKGGNIIAPDSPIFNGKKLPETNIQMRKVRISDSPSGHRVMQFLDALPSTPGKQKVEEKIFDKTIGSEDKVIFPAVEEIPVPNSH